MMKTLRSTSNRVSAKLGHNAKQRIINDNGDDVTPIPLIDNNQEHNLNMTYSALFGLKDVDDNSVDMLSSLTTVTEKKFTVSSLSHNFIEKTLDVSKEELIMSFMQDTAKKESQTEIIRQEKQGEFLNIVLIETHIIDLLDIPSTCIPENHHDAEKMMQKNLAYERLCSLKVGNSRYVERGMQTINEPLKYKSVQTTTVCSKEQQNQVNTWRMYDTYRSHGSVSEKKSLNIAENEAVSEGGSGESEGEQLNSLSTQTLHKLHRTAVIVDNLLCMSKYHSVLAAFRGFQVAEKRPSNSHSTELEKSESNSSQLDGASAYLQLFWAYHGAAVAGKPVSSICCNPSNGDLVAATYARPSIGEQRGLVCCWSLQNPQHPGRIFRPAVAAISCHFSAEKPSLLAVGCYDGSVAIYSVDSAHDSPMLDTFSSDDRHMAAVWTVRFVSVEHVGKPRSEALMTVSQDGRVCRWLLSRGLHSTQIMKLQSEGTKQQQQQMSTAKSSLTSTSTPALHMDVSQHDTSQYLVATQCGSVVRCSSLRTEDCVSSYHGHTAAVVRVQWSPFLADVFASCSLDWSVKVWHVQQTVCVLNLESCVKTAVLDVHWSPHCATQLAFCTAQHVEVWDLSVSTLDCCVVHLGPASTGGHYTCLSYCANMPDCLLLADTAGAISVMKICDMPEPAVVQTHCHVQTLRHIIENKCSRRVADSQVLIADNDDDDDDNVSTNNLTGHDTSTLL